jgi:hypothetical protein
MCISRSISIDNFGKCQPYKSHFPRNGRASCGLSGFIIYRRLGDGKPKQSNAQEIFKYRGEWQLMKHNVFRTIVMLFAYAILLNCSMVGSLISTKTLAETKTPTLTIAPSPMATRTATNTYTPTQTATETLKKRVLFLCDNYHLDTQCLNGKEYTYYLSKYGDKVEFDYTLTGDLAGNLYTFNLYLKGYDKTDFTISILVQRDGIETLIGKAEIPDVENYLPITRYDLFHGEILGDDTATLFGDKLILRIEKFSGMGGSIRVTDDPSTTSSITLP